MASSDKILKFVREDDFVEYHLFPLIQTNDEIEEEKALKRILDKANNIVKKYASNYLWHKDEFKLVIRTSRSNILTYIEDKNEKLQPHLYGCTHFGDNIEDEWFIVFLLQELTKEIPNSVAKVTDSDGEFILIEAADFLPKNANPETTENRVYIYNGKVHFLIPPKSDPITTNEAVNFVRTNHDDICVTDDIQNVINDKLAHYPDDISHNLHYCSVYVPIGVARLLKEKPNLISAAILAFCNRDSLDAKVCRAMKYFPPESRVMCRVKFTKCLYAMINHSKYVPDRKVGWNIPQVNSVDYKKHSLGMKIACGFEILVSQAKLDDNIEFDKDYNIFIQSLKEKEYFKNLLEGSRDYKHLLNKAKEYYLTFRHSAPDSSKLGTEILNILKNFDSSDTFDSSDMCQSDDDDSWLNISPDDLDKMLKERYGQKNITNVNNNTNADEFTQKIANFLDSKSSVDGVEFSDDIRTVKSDSNKVNFDPDSFSNAVQNILNFVIPEDDSWDLESDSDMSEYENDNYVKSNFDKDATEKNDMEKYMEEMDRELSKTTIGESFEKKKVTSEFEDIESFNPVDIDVNALKNILESYKNQLGEAGPSSTMLGPMGIHLNPK